MIVLAVITGIVIIVLIILCIQFNNEGESYSLGIFCGWAMTSLFVLEMICICESVSKPQPKAMDVYQGKTTLEYTIKDGIKVDSVVVWK
jgi:hypothetical protein